MTWNVKRAIFDFGSVKRDIFCGTWNGVRYIFLGSVDTIPVPRRSDVRVRDGPSDIGGVNRVGRTRRCT